MNELTATEADIESAKSWQTSKLNTYGGMIWLLTTREGKYWMNTTNGIEWVENPFKISLQFGVSPSTRDKINKIKEMLINASSHEYRAVYTEKEKDLLANITTAIKTDLEQAQTDRDSRNQIREDEYKRYLINKKYQEDQIYEKEAVRQQKAKADQRTRNIKEAEMEKQARKINSRIAEDRYYAKKNGTPLPSYISRYNIVNRDDNYDNYDNYYSDRAPRIEQSMDRDDTSSSDITNSNNESFLSRCTGKYCPYGWFNAPKYKELGGKQNKNKNRKNKSKKINTIRKRHMKSRRNNSRRNNSRRNKSHNKK